MEKNMDLNALYRSIDARAHDISMKLGSRLVCGPGCAGCCSDDLSVFEIEADNIRAHHADLLENELPFPAGACAFLDEKRKCRIYSDRPYVCRTQGLPLQWIEESPDGTKYAMRDICPENDTGIPIEELPEDDCWIIGPVEEALAMMQYEINKEAMCRVSLRDLFIK